VPWILDPPDTGPAAWARNACREAGFEPDVRYAGSDRLFEILLAERGHAAWVIPGMLLSAVPRPSARIERIPGRPHRRLTTGVRAGAAGQPAIRALREALRQAVREASERAVPGAELGSGCALALSAAGDPGVVRAHPGAAVEQRSSGRLRSSSDRPPRTPRTWPRWATSHSSSASRSRSGVSGFSGVSGVWSVIDSPRARSGGHPYPDHPGRDPALRAWKRGSQ
jgi:hypothetical protein